MPLLLKLEGVFGQLLILCSEGTAYSDKLKVTDVMILVFIASQCRILYALYCKFYTINKSLNYGVRKRSRLIVANVGHISTSIRNTRSTIEAVTILVDSVASNP